MEYLECVNRIMTGLNEQQTQAVKTVEGYVRVVACAGSGKTKALTHRFAYLVSACGVPSTSILCVTFTNKAAGEMKQRVAALLGTERKDEFICTFHSFCVKLLREEIHRLGWPQNFTIADPADMKTMLNMAADKNDIDRKTICQKDVLNDLSRIKTRKGWEKAVEMMLSDKLLSFDSKWTNDEILLASLLEVQHKMFSLDFDDLISFALYLLKNNVEVRKKWSSRFIHIMVDETQDNSIRQWEMIDLLQSSHKNLFVVGDGDQAIYTFRGAMPEQLIDFDKKYSPCTTIYMEKNYRSTPAILQAANSIISNNKTRLRKRLITDKTDEEKVYWYHANDETEEAQFVADKIEELLSQGAKARQIAILYRNKAMSASPEKKLIEKGIKYVIWSGIRFFERKEVKDALSYLRLVARDDDTAFLRIAADFQGVGKTCLHKLSSDAASQSLSLMETAKRQYESLKPGLRECVSLIEGLRNFAKDNTLVEISRFIIAQAQPGKDRKGNRKVDAEEEADRIAYLCELQGAIEAYKGEENTIGAESVSEYLQDIALYTTQDTKNDPDSVKLMTIHGSKGLEFDYTFIIGMNEDILPSARTVAELKKKGMEEERRLAYVAITRAGKKLFLSSTSYLYKRETSPSRFLLEIDPRCIQPIRKCPDYLIEKTQQSIVENPDGVSAFVPGARVRHVIFGEGVIQSVNEGQKSYRVMFSDGFLLDINFGFEHCNIIQ